MTEKRPAALLVYCGLLAAFVVVGAAYGAYTLLTSSEVVRTFADIVIGCIPLAVLTVALAGMWFMRWWAVALFWLCVLLMIVSMSFVPFQGPSAPFLFALTLNAAIWIGVFALPPTLIAVIYRRGFR